MSFFDSFRWVAHAWLWENKNDHHSDFQSSFSIRTSFGTVHNKHWELLYNHATHIKPQDWLSLFPVSTLLRMPHYLFIMARAIISQWQNPPASAFVSYAKHVHWFLFPGSVWVCVCVCVCVCMCVCMCVCAGRSRAHIVRSDILLLYNNTASHVMYASLNSATLCPVSTASNIMSSVLKGFGPL